MRGLPGCGVSVRVAGMDDGAVESGDLSPEDRALYEQYRREVGGEDASLLTAGLLSYPLSQIISMWLRKRLEIGLSGGNDRSPVDVPQEPGAWPTGYPFALLRARTRSTPRALPDPSDGLADPLAAPQAPVRPVSSSRSASTSAPGRCVPTPTARRMRFAASSGPGIRSEASR